MAQVAVTIAGRVYRISCDEGEEVRLGELADFVGGKIEGMRQRFGEIGDQRLTVMAAITIADELAESHRKIAQLQAELADLKGDFSDAANGRVEWAERVAGSLDAAAARIERLAHELNGSARAEA